jgi:putative hydrolase of the HAD superfamily
MFLDIGGVLLTDGWDHHARKRAAKPSSLGRDGRAAGISKSRKAHPGRVFKPGGLLSKATVHPSSVSAFHVRAIEPYPEMIKLVASSRPAYGLKIAVVSNEARELNAYRIRKFKLNGFVDFFISSCFVHFASPTWTFFGLRWTSPSASPTVVYIENTPMFVQIAEGWGFEAFFTPITGPRCAKLASLQI